MTNQDDWDSGERCNFSTGLPTLFALTWFEVLGYTVLLETDQTSNWQETELCSSPGGILLHRLQRSLRRLNPELPGSAIAMVIEHLIAQLSGDLFQRNRQIHTWLTAGMPIEYPLGRQRIKQIVWLVDRFYPLKNDWCVLHPLTLVEGQQQTCLDLVVLINGLPLALIQGLRAGEGNASLQEAYWQFQTHKRTVPSLMTYNTLSIITDGRQARVGTLTSHWQEFIPWLTIDGEEVPVTATTELEVAIQGIFDRRRLLELMQYFIWFEYRDATVRKVIANYPSCPLPIC